MEPLGYIGVAVVVILIFWIAAHSGNN